ncbi:hypothetical protein [Streptomyces sp. NPDC001815]|uniref:hypothetical protein n=1 Tax=Streptomyces sp. NPDC001815 TaxID=3154526 RepID=UPI0033248E75
MYRDEPSTRATPEAPRPAYGLELIVCEKEGAATVENLTLAAGGGSSFWPTGVVMIVVITVIVVLIGIWRSHNASNGTGGPGK